MQRVYANTVQYSCNAFFPEWKVWESYVADTLQGALSMDSLRSSHPIEVPVKRADEINQIFDAISYSKGSCVLRMISTYVGEENFLEGVRRYLKKHAYGNTQTGDLWASLSEASGGKPVEEVMTIWTKNVGYPVITVTEKEDAIHLKQNRLLRTGDVKPEEDKTLYPVLLGIRSKDGIDEEPILSTREAEFKVPDLDFFKLNANHTSLFRTSYSPERLAKLGEAAKKGLLSVEDRAGMIADAGALATSGHQKTSGVLSLLKSFNEETEFVVWNEIITRLASIQSTWIFEDPAIRDGLEAFQRDLVSAKAKKLGWTFGSDDGHIEQQFKSMIFGSAGLSGDKTVIDAAKDMFNRFRAGDKEAIHPNIRGSVFGMALKYGGKDEVSFCKLSLPPFLLPFWAGTVFFSFFQKHKKKKKKKKVGFILTIVLSTTLSSTFTASPRTATSATRPCAPWAVPRTPSSSSARWPC